MNWLLLIVMPLYLAILVISRKLIAGKNVDRLYLPSSDTNFRLIVACWVFAPVMFAIGAFFMRDDNLAHLLEVRVLGSIILVLGLCLSLWAQTQLSYVRRTGGVLRKSEDRTTNMKLLRRGIMASCAGLALILLNRSIAVGLLALVFSIYMPAADESPQATE